MSDEDQDDLYSQIRALRAEDTLREHWSRLTPQGVYDLVLAATGNEEEAMESMEEKQEQEAFQEAGV